MNKSLNLSSTIETVLGPISPQKLGFCHSHEHLFIAPGPSEKVNPALRIDDLIKTKEEVERFKDAGGRSIVDAQPLGCGRMAENLAVVSKETGVNIIASTGFHKLVFYEDDHWIRKIDEDALTELFIDEIENGMFIDGDHKKPEIRINSRPGIIKTASESVGITSEYKRLFLAAARASKRTGTPILSHTEMGKYALEQVQLFTDAGLPPNSIIICHLDRDLSDIEYHKAVAQTGVYLEYDTIGRLKYHGDEDEAKFITKMIDSGFEDSILLGLDTTRERLKSYGGKIGLSYIKESFIPLLLSYGVPQDIIEKFTVINPSKALAKRS